MSNRLQKLNSYKTHPWFKKLYVKLSNRDLKFMHETIIKLDHLNKDEYELKINRLFLDIKDKPRYWKEIQELLANSNT